MISSLHIIAHGCMQLEKANRQIAELQQQHTQAEVERAGLIERAVQATALADSLQKQVQWLVHNKQTACFKITGFLVVY